MAGLLVVLALPARAQGSPSGTENRRELPGTALEAEERDDGSTTTAPWLIGSGVAAAVFIGVGGLVLRRRTSETAGGTTRPSG